ncbi:hypothetical protein FGIG_02185 [Fasciola gigantica]|uniref:Uncharacterized protein n=1 Tax=Fasciola gigantica TaxID=46835 RepID=A0A504YKW5_FASGI|nr:hypothetical protein FGIG_02185 [Fasciola gigantica]
MLEYFSILTVINDIGEKIGDLTVSISIEPVSVSSRANRENYRSENDVDSRVTCPGSPKIRAPVSDTSQDLKHAKSDNREECDEMLNRHSRFSTSDREMLDPTNEHAVDADYDHSAVPSPVGDFVRAETISHEKPPLPQSSKQSVDFGSTEGLSADDLHFKHVFMNEDDIVSGEFNRTIRINKGGIERSVARPKYVSNGIKPAYTDKAPIGSHSQMVPRSPSTPDLRNPQNRLNQFVDLGNQRSVSEQYLQMDLLPVRGLGSASRKPSDQSIVIGRVDPASAPLTFPTDAAFVEAVDDLPDCSDEDSQSDSPMECLIRNDHLLEELFFNNSLIALNNVSMDELKTAILTKNHWRSSSRARLFVHLFTPGSGPHSSPDDVNFLRMSSGLVRARLEMEVEPIWKMPSKQPTGSFGSRSVAEPLTKPVTLSAHPLPIQKPVHSVPRQNPCPTHSSNLAPIALETLLSIPQGRRLRLSGTETNDDSRRRPTNRPQTVNSIPTSAHAYNTSDSVRTVTFGKMTVEHTYLIVRLPWCQTISADSNTKIPKESADPASSVQSCRFNSAVAWMGGSCPSYKFALRTPCILDAEMLGRLAHSFAVIEVWVKMTSGQPDSLLGLAKISTDAFAATFACVDARTGTVSLHSDEILTALRNSLPVVDPFSGVEHGQLRVRLAVGTSLQIESLQFAGDLSTVEDGPHSSHERGSNWQALDLIQWPESRPNQEQNGNQYVEHTLSITIERLFEFDPHVALLSDSQCSGSVPWGDCDCFVQYFFPTTQTSWPRGIPLELWLRIYSPNLRDCLVARGWITEEILTQLIRQTSSSDVDAQIRCAIPLRDVKMERVNGRLDVRLTYSARYVDPPPAVLNTPADATHFGAEYQSVPSLLKNDSIPGVRLVVQVSRCTGLINLVEMRRSEPVTGSGLVRVHCLLLAPTDTYSVGRDGVRSFVLGSATSAPGYDLRVCHQPGITMEVLLPVSWHTLSSSGRASRKEWSLVELLLNGLETQADQFMRRRTNKWSLMIQVDLWLQGPSGPDILSLEWNDLASTDLTKVFHPGPGYRLLGSTRIPLADLIFSQRAHMSNRWYPLCKFVHGQSFATGETEARIGGRFVGGIEVTAQLSDENRAKRHLMRYVARNFSRDSKTAQCLRRWRVPLPVLATGNEEDIPTMEVDEEPYLWHNGTDEYGFSYKHVTIHLDALHMPCAELLLQNDIDVGEGDAVNNRSCHPRASALTAQFTPYVFVRFHFFRHGTQTSRLVAAPRLDSTSSGVVHIDDRKEFTIRVSSAFRAYLVQTELELQVWMLWTSHTADQLIEIGPPKDQCAYSEPIRLGCDPPSPRHIGSLRIPLAHLLYSASSENANDESFSGVNPGRGQAGPATTVTSIRGDPSGLAWWWCESTGQTTGCGGQSHPVFPLYRADTTDLHNAWLAVRLEMCGSRTQMGTHCFGDAASGIEELPTSNTIATGRLGWNLFGLTTANRGLIETVQAGSEPGITEADISEQEAAERGTFPAEVIVEQAYHLRIDRRFLHSQLRKNEILVSKQRTYILLTIFIFICATTRLCGWRSPNELTKSTRSLSAIVSTETPSESSVFVTFAVDGDRTGTLSSHDGLWPRIAQSHVERRHSRVAVTPKMPNTDSVCWNYHRFVRLPLWLVQKYSHRSMVFHVWYQRGSLTSENNSDKKPDSEDPEQPELIGLASVDLTSLSSLFGPTAPGGYATNGGLDQVYGWYHVIDQSGLQRGQILLGVKPLIPGLRDEWSSKPIQQGGTEFLNLPMDRLNIAGSDLVDRLSPLSHMRNLLQSVPILSASHPNILETSPPREPNLKIPLFDSGGTDQTPCEMSRSMLFSSLRTQLEELDAINARFKQRLAGGIFTAEQNIEQQITVPAPENIPELNSPQVSQVSLDPARNIPTSEAKSQFHSPPRPKGGILPSRPILSNTQTNQRWGKGTRSTTIEVAGEFHATFGPNHSVLSCQASNSASQDEQQQSAENPSFGDISYQDRWTDVKCSEITGQPESPSCSPVIPEVLESGTRSVTPSEPSVMGRATPQPDLDMQSFSSDRESHLSGCDHCVVHEGHLEPDTFVRHNYCDTELISQDRDIHPSVEFDHTLDIDEEEVQDTESESCEISPLSRIPSGSTEKEESKSVRPDSDVNSVQTADHSSTPLPRPEVGMAAVDMDNAVEHSCRSWSPSELSDDFEKFTESNENKPCLSFEQVVSSEVVKPPETSNVLDTSRSIANFMLTGPTGLDERAGRLRELRMGKLQFPEPALETPSLKSEGEDLRKRLNNRISQAISQLHTDLEPIAARQNEIQTNATEDPLGTLLAGYRAQSLKNAERVFSSKS